MDESTLKKIAKTIESANLNFFIGSGLSKPFFWTLNNIEKDLTEAIDNDDKPKILSLKQDYFDVAMIENIKIIDNIVDKNKDTTLTNYKNFYKNLNSILLRRENSLLTKQTNIFTTNIDICSETALEELNIDFNDWFSWRFKPKFNIWNFKKSYFKKSLHYENTSEIPVFNLIKIHGSVSWKKEWDTIALDNNLVWVREVQTNRHTPSLFNDSYDKLPIINPTKKKFSQTLFEHYYDLLRIYSNELEKESTVLFVLWFSFADEHIRALTNRVAWANPTLRIYIFQYSNPNDKIKSYKNTFSKFTKEDEKKLFISEINKDYIETLLTKSEIDAYIESILDELSKNNWDTLLYNIYNPIEELANNAKNKNIEVIYPEEGANYSFDRIVADIFWKITITHDKKTGWISESIEDEVPTAETLPNTMQNNDIEFEF